MCHRCIHMHFRSMDTCVQGSLVAQTVKSLPAMQETHIRSLGGHNPLEKEMATHSSDLAENSIGREARQATVHGVAKSQT